MEEKQLVDTISEALKAGDFDGVQMQQSSRSLTISAHKGARTVVVHIADPEPPEGPRFAVNREIPDPGEIRTRARAPSLEGRSGSGGGSSQAKPRKGAAR